MNRKELAQKKIDEWLVGDYQFKVLVFRSSCEKV